ncbi:MAG: hypothetical protein WCJ19_03970 [bacterium]
MDVLSLFLELTKILVWPIVAIVVVILYKENISGLIDRLRTIKGPIGIEIQAEHMIKAQEDASKELSDVEREKKQVEEQNEIDETIYSLQQKSQKRKKNEPLENLYFELDQKDIQLEFERIYNLIFGSQIVLLDLIAETKHLEYKTIETYFKNLKDTNPVFGTWTAWNYIKFLISQGLVEIEQETKLLKITGKGLGFLQYVDECGYIRYKIL